MSQSSSEEIIGGGYEKSCESEAENGRKFDLSTFETVCTHTHTHTSHIVFHMTDRNTGQAFAWCDRPEMLLDDVLPHLWASEEIMCDVLTSTASTYTPHCVSDLLLLL